MIYVHLICHVRIRFQAVFRLIRARIEDSSTVLQFLRLSFQNPIDVGLHNADPVLYCSSPLNTSVLHEAC